MNKDVYIKGKTSICIAHLVATSHL